MYIGALATQFAALEIILADHTLKLHAVQSKNERNFNQSFGQLIKDFKRGIKEKYGDSIVNEKDAKDLISRVKNIAKERNDILHSAWSVFYDGQIIQHRARTKNKSLPLLAEYDEEQLSRIIKAIDEVIELRSDIPYWIDVFDEISLSV